MQRDPAPQPQRLFGVVVHPPEPWTADLERVAVAESLTILYHQVGGPGIWGDDERELVSLAVPADSAAGAAAALIRLFHWVPPDLALPPCEIDLMESA
jgi:hypothetical protein